MSRSTLIGPQASLIIACALLGVLATTGCSNSSAGTPTSPSGNSTPTAADLTACVTQANQARAKAGAPPLSESSSLETFAQAGAQADQTSGAPHGHFLSAANTGIAFAENEILQQSKALGTFQQVMLLGVQAFVAEGVNGPHYQNLFGGYSQLGCGGVISGNQITVVWDFR
jgi:uncharacterized protein YkwD